VASFLKLFKIKLLVRIVVHIFRYNQKIKNMQFKLGQKVKVLNVGGSLLKEGDVGFISEVCSSDNSYRVKVEGKGNYANWVG
jgi:hypothetical protein